MALCPNCHSRFFKTLETRMLVASFNAEGEGTLLLKKRCKRCKHKTVFQKIYPSGKTEVIDHSVWLQGTKIKTTATQSAPGRTRMFSGEYSRKISKEAGKAGQYLKKVKHAETYH